MHQIGKRDTLCNEAYLHDFFASGLNNEEVLSPKQKNERCYKPIEFDNKLYSCCNRCGRDVFLSQTILNDALILKRVWNIKQFAIVKIFFNLMSINIAEFDSKQSHKYDLNCYQEEYQIDLKSKILVGMSGRNSYSWFFGPVFRVDLQSNSKVSSDIEDRLYSTDDLRKVLSGEKECSFTQHEKFVALHVLTRRKFELSAKIAKFEEKKGVWGWLMRKCYVRRIAKLKNLLLEVEGLHKMVREHFRNDLNKIAEAEGSLERLLRIKLAAYGWVMPECSLSLKDKSNTAFKLLSSTVALLKNRNLKSVMIGLLAPACSVANIVMQYIFKKGLG